MLFDSRMCIDAQIKHTNRAILFHTSNISAIRDLLSTSVADHQLVYTCNISVGSLQIFALWCTRLENESATEGAKYSSKSGVYVFEIHSRYPYFTIYPLASYQKANYF